MSLPEIANALWRHRRRILTASMAPGVMAAVAALLLPRWYSAGATLTVDPTLPSLSTTSLLGLAPQLGLGSGLPGATTPQFVVDLLTSRTLQERVLFASLPLGPDGELMTLATYWGGRDPADARRRVRALRKLHRHFTAGMKSRTGVISFSLEGPSPRVAKLMADTALAALNDLLITIRRRRAAAEREFLESRWSALRDSLRANESVLRRFYERNRQIASPELQFEDIRLRREVERVQRVYAEIGMQLEQARIQEVRDTPAIAQIDPPIEPVRKSSPRGSVWALTAALLGAAVAVGVTLVVAAHERLRPAPG